MAAEKPLIWRGLLLAMLRLALGALFVYAGIQKVQDPSQFVRDVQNYRLLSDRTAELTGFYLPWLEIVVGLALVLRRSYAGALILVMMMLLVFSAAAATAWIRGLNIACGCFGSHSMVTDGFEIMIKNGLPLAATITLLLLDSVARYRKTTSSLDIVAVVVP